MIGNVEPGVDAQRSGAQHDRQPEHHPERRPIFDRQVGPPLEPQLRGRAAGHRPAQVDLRVGDGVVVGAEGLRVERPAVAIGLRHLPGIVQPEPGPHAELQLVRDARRERQVQPEAGHRAVVVGGRPVGVRGRSRDRRPPRRAAARCCGRPRGHRRGRPRPAQARQTTKTAAAAPFQRMCGLYIHRERSRPAPAAGRRTAAIGGRGRRRPPAAPASWPMWRPTAAR